ncbi:MAG: rhomboid family intramembrane serine protease, partial [Planctomycetota bacterium]
MAYYRTPYSPQVGLGGRITPGVKALLIANVSVFALQIVAQQVGGVGIEPIFGLTPVMVYRGFYLWQLVTYMFLHSTGWLSHLLLNMLMLWMF